MNQTTAALTCAIMEGCTAFTLLTGDKWYVDWGHVTPPPCMYVPPSVCLSVCMSFCLSVYMPPSPKYRNKMNPSPTLKKINDWKPFFWSPPKKGFLLESVNRVSVSRMQDFFSSNYCSFFFYFLGSFLWFCRFILIFIYLLVFVFFSDFILFA